MYYNDSSRHTAVTFLKILTVCSEVKYSVHKPIALMASDGLGLHHKDLKDSVLTPTQKSGTPFSPLGRCQGIPSTRRPNFTQGSGRRNHYPRYLSCFLSVVTPKPYLFRALFIFPQAVSFLFAPPRRPSSAEGPMLMNAVMTAASVIEEMVLLA